MTGLKELTLGELTEKALESAKATYKEKKDQYKNDLGNLRDSWSCTIAENTIERFITTRNLGIIVAENEEDLWFSWGENNCDRPNPNLLDLLTNYIDEQVYNYLDDLIEDTIYISKKQ